MSFRGGHSPAFFFRVFSRVGRGGGIFFFREAEADSQGVQPHDVEQYACDRHRERRLHRVRRKSGEGGRRSAVYEGIAYKAAQHHERAACEHGSASRERSEDFSAVPGAEKPHQESADKTFRAFYHQCEKHRRGVYGKVGEKGAESSRDHRRDGTEERRGDEYHRIAAVEEEIPCAKPQYHRRRHRERGHQRGENKLSCGERALFEICCL